jgi:hypothetical protein
MLMMRCIKKKEIEKIPSRMLSYLVKIAFFLRKENIKGIIIIGVN